MNQKLYAFLTLLVFAAASQSNGQALDPSPAPATWTAFDLPLANGTTGQAMVLPSSNGSAYLVWTTPNGKLGFRLLTQPTDPQPQPEPTPTPPPAPPVKRPITIVTVTETTQAALPAEVEKHLDQNQGKYFAFTIEMVAEKNPPPNSLLWIGRTAGKPYPYTFVADQDGNILWQGPTPSKPTDFLTIVKNYSIRVPNVRNCDSGTCPTTRSNRRWHFSPTTN